MKLRMIALAGVAALALSGPAVASDAQGWYLGLGAGWDHMGNVEATYPPSAFSAHSATNDSVLLIGSFGYRFADRIRAEGEFGYDTHDLNSPDADGHVQIGSALINVSYDAPLSDKWDFTFGAGAGVGRADILAGCVSPNSVCPTPTPVVLFADGTEHGYMWQGMAGFNYSVSDNLDLSLDWRYRSLSVNKSYASFWMGYPAHVKDLNEQAVVLSLRWYVEEVEAAPPPPPPPPPPPAPPPPVTTFIVFFDFNKSNLTAEAQSVVTEAVKTAKDHGFVKVMVTGHTDTVGSDSYNMGLSVRRAQAVKDEMVRQGMGGDGISIEGKGFHDPLVPTGPGVREPQNRRAVIDLGS